MEVKSPCPKPRLLSTLSQQRPLLTHGRFVVLRDACLSAGLDEKSCPLQGEAGSCHGDGLKNRGIYLNPWIKGGVKRRDLRMSLFFYLALISHSITIYAKIVQRVACLAYIPLGNGGFPLKTELGPFRALPGWRTRGRMSGAIRLENRCQGAHK